ncbi:MAG: site-specific integrase, partial [Gemmatimonadota bacterium]|nr:site-specific integrase [Gemmatimonadota bacterium]
MSEPGSSAGSPGRAESDPEAAADGPGASAADGRKAPAPDDADGARWSWTRDFLRYAEHERRLSPHTVAAYRRDLRQFESFVTGYEGAGSWEWTEVDRITIRSFLGELESRGLRRSTIQRKLAAIRSFFAFLQRTDRIESSPARLVRTPRKERALPGFLSE